MFFTEVSTWENSCTDCLGFFFFLPPANIVSLTYSALRKLSELFDT